MKKIILTILDLQVFDLEFFLLYLQTWASHSSLTENSPSKAKSLNVVDFKHEIYFVARKLKTQ